MWDAASHQVARYIMFCLRESKLTKHWTIVNSKLINYTKCYSNQVLRYSVLYVLLKYFCYYLDQAKVVHSTKFSSFTEFQSFLEIIKPCPICFFFTNWCILMKLIKTITKFVSDVYFHYFWSFFYFEIFNSFSVTHLNWLHFLTV